MSLESVKNEAERKVKQAIEEALRGIQDEKRRGDIRRKYLESYGFPKSFVVHHLIPVELRYEEVVKRAQSKGWDINDIYKNGMPLPSNREESELWLLS